MICITFRLLPLNPTSIVCTNICITRSFIKWFYIFLFLFDCWHRFVSKKFYRRNEMQLCSFISWKQLDLFETLIFNLIGRRQSFSPIENNQFRVLIYSVALRLVQRQSPMQFKALTRISSITAIFIHIYIDYIFSFRVNKIHRLAAYLMNVENQT